MSPLRCGTYQLGGSGRATTYAAVDTGYLDSSWRKTLHVHLDFANDDSWAHEICNDDNEERAIVIASMNEMAYVLQAWLPLIVWQQIEAPQYRKGFITSSCLSTLLIITAFTVRYLFKKELQRYASPSTGQNHKALLTTRTASKK